MVGIRIGKYLADNGIKQSFVAEKVGITSPQMSEICNKQGKNIDCVLYYKICKTLNVPLETFLEGDGE
jgi:transcriptional regulator with XRE-family HTH domain